MKSFWKTYTFWISLCAWLVSMGGQYAEVIPSPYGLVVGNAAALVYAVARCLQKRQAGIPWKGIFFTSEFLVTGATVLINFLESLKSVPALSPRALAIVSATIVGLGSLLHTFGGGKSPFAAGKPLSADQANSLLGVEGVVSSPASEAVTKVEEKDKPKTDAGQASADRSSPDKGQSV